MRLGRFFTQLGKIDQQDAKLQLSPPRTIIFTFLISITTKCHHFKKSYATSSEMVQDVGKSARNDGFAINKKNEEGIILKGTSRCYKSGTSTAQVRGTVKTDGPFNLHFTRHQATGTYAFTKNYNFTHNHPLEFNFHDHDCDCQTLYSFPKSTL